MALCIHQPAVAPPSIRSAAHRRYIYDVKLSPSDPIFDRWVHRRQLTTPKSRQPQPPRLAPPQLRIERARALSFKSATAMHVQYGTYCYQGVLSSFRIVVTSPPIT